jgi:hypothetical protein
MGKLEGAIGVLEGDLKARDARRRRKDNVQVISKETGLGETNTDMGQGRTSGGLSHHWGTQCGKFLDCQLTNNWVFMKHSPTCCYYYYYITWLLLLHFVKNLPTKYVWYNYLYHYTKSTVRLWFISETNFRRPTSVRSLDTSLCRKVTRHISLQ